MENDCQKLNKIAGQEVLLGDIYDSWKDLLDTSDRSGVRRPHAEMMGDSHFAEDHPSWQRG